MRTCSRETKAQLKRRNAPPLHPAWVFTAYWDALNERPMSVNREKRLREAMGLNKPPRASRRFYRPCLSVELGEMIKEYNLDVTAILCAYVAIHIRQKEEDGRIVYYDNTTR